MDSLTQLVLGAGVGELVLGKKAGNKAMLWGAIAGTIPDLDVLAALVMNPLHAMVWHRGFMHSIVFCLLFAPVLGWLIHRISKNKTITAREWSKLSWWALVTHPLLDAFTTWGTQLFWPFETRVTLNGVFVIDPLYTLPFLILLILCMRLDPQSEKRKKLARAALIVSSSYLLLGLSFKYIAKGIFEDQLQKASLTYYSTDVKPMPFTILYWECTAESENVFYNAHYSLLGNPDVIRFRSIPKNHSLADSLGFSAHPDFQKLVFISKGYYALQANADTLYFHDLRFGQTDGISAHIEKRSNFVYVLQRKDDALLFERKAPAIAQGLGFLAAYFKRVLGNE